MQARPFRSMFSAFVAFGLLLAMNGMSRAQDDASGAAPAPAAAPASPPTMGKVGPGAPGAAPKAAATKAAPVSKGIHVSATTPVAHGVNVHEKVLEECHLQSRLPQAIASRNSDVVLSEGGEQKLELKITDIHAPNGGVFSGPKWVTVEGRLLQGKSLKGSFVAKQTSMGSMTACGMLDKVVEVIGADIAEWLKHPSKNSRLGKAR